MSNDMPPLPTVENGELSWSQVAEYAQQIEQFATDIAIQIKAGSKQYAEDLSVLSAAVVALQQGTVRGVQVRYFYLDEWWMDTLLALPLGVRIVRMAVPPV